MQPPIVPCFYNEQWSLAVSLLNKGKIGTGMFPFEKGTDRAWLFPCFQKDKDKA